MTIDYSAPYLRNRSAIVNRVSPYARRELLSESRPEGIYVDDKFGYTWTFDVREGDALYGLTPALPVGPLEEHGNGRFTRIPFRRIPRIEILSFDEFLTIARGGVKRMNGYTLMWRGQGTEYPLKRENEDKLKLYGDIDVAEPSLTSSASRSGVRFEEYMEGWMGLVDIYIEERLAFLSKTYAPGTIATLRSDTEVWQSHYNYKLWGFASAQHYGLPSTGLDLTSSAEVALFFALHKISSPVDGRIEVTRLPASAKPVIFMMAVNDADRMPDEEIGPLWIQLQRPKAQHAYFFGSAWGDATNRAAERIIAVLELHNHATWPVNLSPAAIFPPRADDPFCAFLLSARARFPFLDRRVPLERVYYWA